MKNRYILLATLVLLASGCMKHAAAPTGRTVTLVEQNVELAEYLESWAEENGFNGVLGVQDKSGQETYYVRGVADQSTLRALTRYSAFQTGSVDKFFAAIAVFSLAEKNVLDLDAPITEYLSDYRLDTGQQITLADLMSNRSGLPDEYRVAMGEVIQAIKTSPNSTSFPLSIEEGVHLFGSGDLSYAPGSKFEYVNVNWVLVHHILEEVTGEPYGDVLGAHVFEPAGMQSSGTFVWDLSNTTPPAIDTAIGFKAQGKPFETDWPLPSFLGGGTYTTAQDMLALMRALYSHQILNTESLERFSTVSTEEESYAFGGRVTAYQDAPEQLYSWQSGSNGATTMIAIHKIGEDFSFVGFSNFAFEQDALFSLSSQVEAFASNGS